ncbi:glycosyltransferase [Desulforhopalus singaporensis]|uniref:Glycosyltransferase involved in cell wall bisynthesis n=1 Tax=Desulforhopalus singaporensis TaxID=91360 RepID=A0A1H0UHY3_9BACT|nr:glycosyltransferase [Desulforhopalus singaporensis]SDP65784.1 Glycosyltransferase involved in cell wall bisynthesis [Desulforhopalus singaporensis]
MKIIQFMASSGYGGAEMVMVELANKLSARHDVFAIILADSVYRDKFDEKVTIVPLTSHPTINNPLLHYEIYRIVKDIGPDLVHTHAVKGSILISRINRFCKIPHLGTKHNDRKGKIFNRLQWVSAVSAKVKASITNSCGLVEVITNGIEPLPLAPAPRPDTFTILSVGRLDRIKGFAELITQAGLLNFDFSLKIAGTGGEHDKLKTLVKSLRLESKVEFLGHREDIDRQMAAAHLVVIASHKEGGPKTAIECLFYGNCLLSTPVGLIPEILPGEMVTSHDALAAKITEIYRNYPLFEHRFDEIKKKHRQRFLLGGVVTEYESYYRKILSQAG